MEQPLPTTPVLTPTEIRRISTAWLVRQRHQWSVTALRVLIGVDPDTAWRVIVRIVHEAADEPALVSAGAGPLTDILNEYGDTFVERAEDLAAVSQVFQRALRHVSLSDDALPAARRLRALGCGRIADAADVEDPILV
jgi:hypothetical protein